MININGKEYEEDVEVISGSGRTYKMPLEDYLEQQAYQYGYDSYEDLYNKGLRIRHYEDLNPSDLKAFLDNRRNLEAKNEQKENESINTQSTQETFENKPKNKEDYSKYQDLFNTFSYGRTLDLRPTKDNQGNEYPTLMTAIIDDDECNIVSIAGKETKLNYIDSKGKIHSTDSNPNIFACDMKFRYIDPAFKDVINKYWDKLNLDEIMKVYETLADELERFSGRSKD